MSKPERSAVRHLLTGGWPENIASALAFAGLLIAVFIGFNPHGRQNAGSDFKTLYASAWCFTHHQDGYQFPAIAAVFDNNDVVQPLSWYGHAPVYPPFTLAMLAPLTAIPMVPAIWIWIALSGLLMGLATAALARAAGRVFGIGVLSRIFIVGLIAASPLLSLGLELGNVSVAVVGLCILALTTDERSNAWLPAAGLAAAFILKPHIAFWPILAILLSRSPVDRRLLWRTAAIASAALVAITLWMVADHSLLTQMSSYRAMVISELSNGSMAPGNRDLMEIVVQITSFSHLLGYLFGQGTVAHILNALVLAVLAAAVGWSAWRYGERFREPRYVIAPAVCSFGFIATYHREADGILLVILLPFVLFRLSRNLRDVWAWCALCLLIAGSLGPPLETLQWLADKNGIYSALLFVALRQAAIVNLCLTLLLLGTLLAADRSHAPRSSEFAR